jgi:hypothetical protein
MNVSSETVDIARNIHTVFEFLTDFANIQTIFEHVADVHYARGKSTALSCQFQQTRIVHGRCYPETVTVIVFETNTHYNLKVSSYGVDNIYAYSLEPIGAEATRVRLTKQSQAKGWRKLLLPLVYHLLTRPEHDGRHLQVLKAAIERS